MTAPASEQRIDRFLRAAGLEPLQVSVVDRDVVFVQFRHLANYVWIETRYSDQSTDESVARDIMERAATRGIRPRRGP